MHVIVTYMVTAAMVLHVIMACHNIVTFMRGESAAFCLWLTVPVFVCLNPKPKN